jgi:DNA polymerase III subunit epsilon
VGVQREATRQTSLDDLGTPLNLVRFCVIDLETTGTSPTECAITEIAAARFEGGVCTGTFTTLVNPGVPIPPQITYITGITEDMVGPAPRIDSILPALLEFVRDDIIVGHNVRFDLGFLNAALEQRGYDRFSNRSVDTLRLARRLLRDDSPDCKLGTLALHLGLKHQPTHRAMHDVMATADLLHFIFERAAGLGVMGLDDLMELPTLGRHPSAAKLKLTNALPRRPGVYLFRDASGKVLYVGKATNLRARVRSYFGFDERRKVGPLLQITAKIDHFECPTPIEAAIMEVRLIQYFLPRFNRQSKFWTQYAYIRIGGTAGKPDIAAVRDPVCKPTSWLLGPLPSLAAARAAALALRETLVGLDPATKLSRSVIDRPDLLLAPLETHMRELGTDEQFEAAAQLRDRAGALARAITRQQRSDMIRAQSIIEVEWNHNTIRVERGRVCIGNKAKPVPLPTEGAVPCNYADELNLLGDFLDRQAAKIRPVQLEGNDVGLTLPIVPVPRFTAKTETKPATRPASNPVSQPATATAAKAAKAAKAMPPLRRGAATLPLARPTNGLRRQKPPLQQPELVRQECLAPAPSRQMTPQR